MLENIGAGISGSITPQGLTPRTKRIVELAFAEAARMGNNYVGTEHLLLGLCARARVSRFVF